MIIDFRSDTVTRPSREMLDCMHSAEVGDAIFGDDPSVLNLESYAADLFGMDAGLFCPSGTMSNQIAIKAHTKPGDQLICDHTAHVYFYEGGGAALHSGISCRLLDGNGGRFSADQVEDVINPDDPHLPRTKMVSIENTSNKGGGTYWDFSEIEKIKKVCARHGLALHLDGARLFNALIETPESPSHYGELFDSISICLSKGLGAPMGSLLLGNSDFIHEAARMRKAFGGAMRQAGYMAAAGLFALRNNTGRLSVDHENAKRLSDAFADSGLCTRALPASTNIVMVDFETPEALRQVVEKFASRQILVAPMGPKRLRLVTHLDITEQMMDKTLNFIKELSDE